MNGGAVVWHDVECGGYHADLPIWERLASEAEGPVLELGCGTGRVTLHLARRGHTVVGLDCEAELVDSLRERARGLPVEAVLDDVRRPELKREVALAIAPMQVLQLLESATDRAQCLAAVAGVLPPGGRFAAAIVEALPGQGDGATPIPDVHDVDGWVYSSLPVDAAVDDGDIVVRRLRQTVSPAGNLEEEPNEIRIHALSAERLEAEAGEVGLAPHERLRIPPTDLHVGSTIVVLTKAG
ncbi:MAG: class I SAM-dependent methyltransferase [Solirubrobacterales bacterium]